MASHRSRLIFSILRYATCLDRTAIVRYTINNNQCCLSPFFLYTVTISSPYCLSVLSIYINFISIHITVKNGQNDTRNFLFSSNGWRVAKRKLFMCLNDVYYILQCCKRNLLCKDIDYWLKNMTLVINFYFVII